MPGGIALVGDVHGEWPSVTERLLALRPDVAVFVGDFYGHQDRPPYRPLRDLMAPVLEAGIVARWIQGNHDTDSAELVAATFESMPEENIHGRVKELAGLRVAGLGGVFRGRVWTPGSEPKVKSRAEFIMAFPPRGRYRGNHLPARHWATIFFEDVGVLGQQKADVLVCHEAPSSYFHEARGVRGWDIIDELAAKMAVQVVVHGHHHHSYGRRMASGVLGVGLGLAEVSMLDDLVAAGERDGPLS